MITIDYADCRTFQMQGISLEQLCVCLPENIVEEIMGFVRPQDRYIRALGKVLLQFQLARLGYAPEILTSLQLSSFGKPFLPQPLSFNISHSAYLVMCAISEDSRLGIDIEQIRPFETESMQDLFTQNEWEHIKKDDSLHNFFHLWSQKESIIKADGRGLQIELKDIRIDSPYARIKDSVDEWFLYPLAVDKEFVSYLCADVAHASVRLSAVQPADLI